MRCAICRLGSWLLFLLCGFTRLVMGVRRSPSSSLEPHRRLCFSVPRATGMPIPSAMRRSTRLTRQATKSDAAPQLVRLTGRQDVPLEESIRSSRTFTEMLSRLSSVRSDVSSASSLPSGLSFAELLAVLSNTARFFRMKRGGTNLPLPAERKTFAGFLASLMRELHSSAKTSLDGRVKVDDAVSAVYDVGTLAPEVERDKAAQKDASNLMLLLSGHLYKQRDSPGVMKAIDTLDGFARCLSFFKAPEDHLKRLLGDTKSDLASLKSVGKAIVLLKAVKQLVPVKSRLWPFLTQWLYSFVGGFAMRISELSSIQLVDMVKTIAQLRVRVDESSAPSPEAFREAQSFMRNVEIDARQRIERDEIDPERMCSLIWAFAHLRIQDNDPLFSSVFQQSIAKKVKRLKPGAVGNLVFAGSVFGLCDDDSAEGPSLPDVIEETIRERALEFQNAKTLMDRLGQWRERASRRRLGASKAARATSLDELAALAESLLAKNETSAAYAAALSSLLLRVAKVSPVSGGVDVTAPQVSPQPADEDEDLEEVMPDEGEGDEEELDDSFVDEAEGQPSGELLGSDADPRLPSTHPFRRCEAFQSVFDRLCGVLQDSPSVLDSQGLSNVVWSAGTLKVASPALFAVLKAAILPRLGSSAGAEKMQPFGSTGLTQIVFGLSLLKNQDPELLVPLLSECEDHVDEFQPYELSQVLTAMALLNTALDESQQGAMSPLRESILQTSRAVVDQLRGSLRALTARQLAFMIWSLGQLRQRSRPLHAGQVYDWVFLNNLCYELRNKLDSLVDKEFPLVLDGFASLRWTDEHVLEGITGEVAKLSSRFTPPQLIMLSGAVVKLGITDKRLNEALAASVEGVIDSFHSDTFIPWLLQWFDEGKHGSPEMRMRRMSRRLSQAGSHSSLMRVISKEFGGVDHLPAALMGIVLKRLLELDLCHQEVEERLDEASIRCVERESASVRETLAAKVAGIADVLRQDTAIPMRGTLDLVDSVYRVTKAYPASDDTPAGSLAHTADCLLPLLKQHLQERLGSADLLVGRSDTHPSPHHLSDEAFKQTAKVCSSLSWTDRGLVDPASDALLRRLEMWRLGVREPMSLDTLQRVVGWLSWAQMAPSRLQPKGEAEEHGLTDSRIRGLVEALSQVTWHMVVERSALDEVLRFGRALAPLLVAHDEADSRDDETRASQMSLAFCQRILPSVRLLTKEKDGRALGRLLAVASRRTPDVIQFAVNETLAMLEGRDMGTVSFKGRARASRAFSGLVDGLLTRPEVGETFMQALMQAAQDRLPSLLFDSLINLILATERVFGWQSHRYLLAERRVRDLVQQCLREAVMRGPGLSRHETLKLLTTFSQLGMCFDDYTRYALDELEPSLPSMPPKALASLASCMGQLGLTEDPYASFFQKIAFVATSRASEFTRPQEVSIISRALSIAGVYDEEWFAHALSLNWTAALPHTLLRMRAACVGYLLEGRQAGRATVDDEEISDTLLAIATSQGAFMDVSSPSPVSRSQQDLYFRLAHIFEAMSPVLPSARRSGKNSPGLPMRWEVFQEHHTDFNLTLIDVAIVGTPVGGRGDVPLVKVAVELDGPHHFVELLGSSPVPLARVNGYTQLKTRLLSAMGWRVVRVPWWEAATLASQHAGDAYLLSRVEAAIGPFVFVPVDVESKDSLEAVASV
ncbi:unnamed protein product [Vitrella brassicaformis CCMP3155]|uniref:RAP domain-containing protein n=1 Tax=Vitrella brassicaformis (strain CCMP3155) TaxID=1169540 RepID=A0A0G4GJJ9_VITBC|nr:unnamed protein product [Vitrella brassicaformis CCMP3155]|eukprot:CEM30122.1 unnamed protein product [Vitrella brassicaformis CCMP3155]